MDVFGQGSCDQEKVVLFGQSACIRANFVVFFQIGCIPVKWLYSGKSCCLWAKVDVFGQKWLYSDKEVVLG